MRGSTGRDLNPLSRDLGSLDGSDLCSTVFYICDMIRASSGGSRFPLMQPLTMASMKQISEEARGSSERKGACSFSSSMRLRRLEGSPHKGLFKRAPRIQSPGFPRPLTTCSRVCTVPCVPFSVIISPQAWTPICKDPNGLPARSDCHQPWEPRAAGAVRCPYPSSGT